MKLEENDGLRLMAICIVIAYLALALSFGCSNPVEQNTPLELLEGTWTMNNWTMTDGELMINDKHIWYSYRWTTDLTLTCEYGIFRGVYLNDRMEYRGELANDSITYVTWRKI